MPRAPKTTAKHPILKRLGTRIRHERKRKHWSQETLAAESGMDRAYISDIELGLRRFSVIHLVKIAKALALKVGELFPE